MEAEEIAVLTIGAFFLIFQILATLYLFINRNYGPFKAKQIDLIILSVISEIFWFIGLVPSVHMLPSTGVWSLCALWQLWFNLVLGLYLWGAILQLRFVKLFLFERRVKWANWQMNLLLLVYWFPSIMLALVGTVLSNEIFDDSSECIMNNDFLFPLAVCSV